MKDHVVVVHGCWYATGLREIVGGQLVTLTNLLASAKRFTTEEAEDMKRLCATARFVEFPSGNGGMPDCRPRVLKVRHGSAVAEAKEAAHGD